MNTANNFNATEYCSRKLWEMVSGDNYRSNRAELKAAVAELAERRHYLSELEKLGIFDARRD